MLEMEIWFQYITTYVRPVLHISVFTLVCVELVLWNIVHKYENIYMPLKNHLFQPSWHCFVKL